ncbi:hypothetical protein [Nostoc sp.]|uniref:hypothetical protein n=1 Tax=Nostoc sp. TaxID=1180 RepID=UPI0030046457
MTLERKSVSQTRLALSVGAASLRVAMPQALRNSTRRSCVRYRRRTVLGNV